MDIAHVRAGAWPETTAGRLASAIRATALEDAEIALIGLPDDTGVGMNGGRVGAAGGPRALRAALARYGASEAAGVNWPRVADAGDVQPGRSLEETHDRVTEAVREVVAREIFPVGIGGGHDLTYAFVRALAADRPGMVGIYLDAHLDVRAEAGSGMAFRRLVDECRVAGLYVQGLDWFSNAAAHRAWFSAHGGRVDALDVEGDWPTGELFFSIDLDVIDQAFAPGVSAMNPCGWMPERADAWARAAGACGRVRCLDIMELNPAHDEGGRTARLAARLFCSFLCGFAERDR